VGFPFEITERLIGPNQVAVEREVCTIIGVIEYANARLQIEGQRNLEEVRSRRYQRRFGRYCFADSLLIDADFPVASTTKIGA